MIRKLCCSRFSLHKLDPIQKRAPARSLQLEALLYHQIFELYKVDLDNFFPEPNGATEGCSPSKVILTHFSTLTRTWAHSG